MEDVGRYCEEARLRAALGLEYLGIHLHLHI